MSADHTNAKNRGARVKRWITPFTAIIVVGGVIVGAAVGTGGDAAERAKLVDVPSLGISVPISLTEQLDMDAAQRVGNAYNGRSVFHAVGMRDYAGYECILVARQSGATDVVPFVCDTPEVAASRGLDVGESTPEGGLEGVLVRGADNRWHSEGYSVGPDGGTVVLSPGDGDAVTFEIPNLAELDEAADRALPGVKD
jgi:hypothetical protein